MAHCTKLSVVPTLLSGLILSPGLMAQVIYSENFRSPSMPGVDGEVACDTGMGGPGNYAFPVDWLLRNVDNRTPNSAVGFVNDAWEVREDFVEPQVTNCVAFSTSWYSPAGAANDFMWSPVINIPAGGAALSWRARAPDPNYPDGYEVRVMPAASGPPTGGSGVIGNQITSSSVVFSTPGEASAWTTRTVDLTAFAGQGIHVGFRNNSNDQFLLMIDDVRVFSATPDLAAETPRPILPYARVPAALIYTPELGLSGANVGGVELTNVTASAQLVRDTVDQGAPIPASAPVATLAIGATAPIPFATAPATISGAGEWSVRYVAAAAQAEAPGVQANNTIASAGVTVNASELARHEGAVGGILGIGAGNGGELGVQFTIPNTITFSAVRFSLGAKDPEVDDGMGGTRPSTWAGNPITASLRSLDTGTNTPGALIDTTISGTTAFAATTYELAFSAGPQVLAAGTYVVTINEPILATFPQDGTLSLEMHDARFQTGTVWVNWPTIPTGGWTNTETFGATFARTPAITLIAQTVLPDLLVDGFEAPVPPDTSSTPNPTGNGSTTARRSKVTSLKLAKPTVR